MPKRNNSRGPGRPGGGRGEREEKEFEQSLVDIARVTRVKAGGKRLSFRALVVIGDKKGRVGSGIGKGIDVATAVDKAVAKAKKNLINVQIIKGTISHEIFEKFKACKVLLKPAKQGKGVIAGGSVRTVLELAGIENVVSKIRGSASKINNVMATMNALKKLRKIEIKEDVKKAGSGEKKGDFVKKQESKKTRKQTDDGNEKESNDKKNSKE
ncbi:30S ribosomal protein S5 [Candidatus Falkowbacteria bacterium]|nr:30S ribosomal protein S5 [Candidatus Falkowbacteria bacterium]